MYPSKTYRYVLKKGMTGHDVWALQIALNARNWKLTEDGNFGALTESAVKGYQGYNNLVADGVAGVLTQRSLALFLSTPYEKKYTVAPGLLKGLIEGESGYIVGAVNWSIPGGVDCGWVQRRVYEANYSDTAFHEAFSPTQFDVVAANFRQLKDKFKVLPAVTTDKRAWQLAVLSHNWPAGADQLSRGIALSTAPATWVENIGVPGVVSPAQWADYYISSKTAYVTSWPA